MKLKTALAASVAFVSASGAMAADLEVTHWWTSGGEAAAVAEFAKAVDAKTSHNWIDGAIAGSGGTARPIIISRILGGDPMAATQLNHGRQAEELIEAGLMTDLTELAEAEGWRDIVNPSSLLDSCTFEGRIYCVPVNIHSTQWLWLSHDAFEKAGVEVPKDWFEFVSAAPALEKAGLVPLAMGQQGWQQSIAFGAITISIVGVDTWRKVTVEKNADVAAGPEYAKVFQAAADARELARESNVQDWNLATNMVITGKAGGQIMGDWAQGEFAVAEQVAGQDYSCLPGLGLNQIIDTGGDAFYFPVVDDAEVKAAQLEMASILISKEAQVNFNLAKGSLPVRGDIDLSAANDCMQKGLSILADGGVLPNADQTLTADTQTQIQDLLAEFWASDMPAADAQASYAAIIADAD
ncbi:carbohydrate ABC transporter substrate-binding protein, CUT1 family [Aliiroseovarius halocynthiae]|uniref:Probable sugar-binding periplasmic protein n=1 Tax=Aliiroseovarius halocynthiae TaxID=985055 RepID=A0A545SUI0_9RHOB|nr:ABC transporter substrate-binding protein [Aliiroseovarius halocynthiae]TQV68631.1 carbohydrate ABC transporter substrate-binding protein [Aliiroseovarius halocynthiae]SMR71049.1 carbohydrate ABC transporter substrate-binding protein, CUT1 family [Aliiroseovarius halocynthiae]